MDNVTKKERVFYLDLMRIIAIFNVIILHIAAYFWAEQPINSYNFNIMTMYDSLVRFCVPLFVMISGILWLNPKKEVDIKNIYRKNILKIVIAFIFWSSIYSALEVLFLGGIGIEEFIWKCVTGHYHMWFLYMIIGLYIITPLIRKITFILSLDIIFQRKILIKE